MAQQTVNNFQHQEQQDTVNIVDQWRIDIQQLVSETRSSQSSSSSVCIFRVPKLLRDINQKSYDPQMVSLGPLHWEKLSTQMHDHKVEAVAKMLERSHTKIDIVVAEIRELVDKIRGCYNEDIKFDGKTLAWMMTLDGCFLLEFVRTISKKNASEGENSKPISIFADNSIEFLPGYVLLGDIMMLENQIPLCVLVKLLQLELGSGEENAQKELCDWAYRCLLRKACPFKVPRGTQQELRDELNPEQLLKDSKHLLDFWRLCMEKFLNASVADGKPGPIPFIPSAKELKFAGIEIKACKTDELNDIRFVNKRLCGAALFLPPLLVSDTTEIVIRNLMALEECRASPPNRISRYIELMDSLIDVREDVSLLIKNGIIDNRLGSEEEVVAMFNKLCKGITSKSITEFDEMLRQMKNYHDGKLNVMIAELVQKNFTSPWVALSLVGAILILLMTALQTIYLVYSVYK